MYVINYAILCVTTEDINEVYFTTSSIILVKYILTTYFSFFCLCLASKLFFSSSLYTLSSHTALTA